MSAANKVESNPTWTSPARQFVPLHLQPGSTRSSFARPDTYNLHRPKSSSSSASSPPQQRAQRTSFATHPKSKSKRLGPRETDDDLPPTLSIRVMGSHDLDTPDASVPNYAVGSAASANGNSINTNNAAPRGTPVIVFGFPPGSTQSVLHYFGKFGEITENVASSENQGPAAAAIECGRNWLRITYRDLDSAQRALAQNGHLMPGQYVIGCVPAEAGEYTSTMQQSSTNSLLLDDSEVSLLQDHSMASVLEGDQTEDRITTDSARSLSQQLPQPQEPPQNQLLPDKIVPREISSQLFREPAAQENKSKIHMSEINSTVLPDKPAPTSLVGKITNAVAHAFLNWDV